jgi:hypothetical protein
MTDRKPALVHAWMSTTEMIAACGLQMRQSTTWTYSVFDTASKQKLFTGTMQGIKTWLRREGYVK